MSNAITQLSGPQLLLLYVTLVTVAAGACRWWRERSDDSRFLPPLVVPEKADAYEVACLRGGESKLVLVALADLVERGYLRVDTRLEGWWKRARKYIVQHQDPGLMQLNGFERAVFESFRSGRRIDAVFANSELSMLLKGENLRCEEKLHAQRLLNGDEARSRATVGRKVAVAALAVAAGALWIAGALDDTAVWFLGVIAIVALQAVFLASTPNRLSFRGRTYLKALQQRWAAGGTSRVPAALTAGLFGLALLSGPTFAALAEAYKKSQAGTFQWSAEVGGGDGDGCGGCCGGCGD